MKQILIILALLFTLSNEAFSADGELKLHLTFNPAGNFDINSKKLKGNIIKKDGKLTAKKLWVRIQNLSTGIDLRDQHFWEYMNYKNHPKARLTEVFGEKGKATGILEVNGIKKQIQVSYKEKGNLVNANFSIKASDFSLPQKSFLGISVNDEVKVQAQIQFVTK